MEGTTQGDTLAMAFYGISTKPILISLSTRVREVSQVWFADDATGGGNLYELRKWWDLIKEIGAKYGYHVKPSKSYLILKDGAKEEEAKKLFESSPINITVEGKRHLGAAIGSQEFKEEYISEKVAEWCKQVKNLSKMAKSQPHAAYAAYIHGEQHKFNYFLRTLDGISEELKPLDDVIENEFLPALFGTSITTADRKILALPIRDGGLGIRTISDSADRNHKTSITLTKPLINSIIEQATELPNKDEVKNAKTQATTITTTAANDYKKSVMESLSDPTKRSIEQIAQPGASSWLGAYPLKSQGMNLSKEEFQDALCLRYNKNLKNLPAKCPCGATFTVTHAMNCKRGGFINARHDNLRDFVAQLLEKVCNDVETEPHLQPVAGQRFKPSANTSDEARSDCRARGYWRPGQNSFFDLCITNADADSNKERTVAAVLRSREQAKKTQYNQRIMDIDHGTFTPLILTIKGVMGHECEKFFKTLAEKLAKKKGERYEEIMRYIRIKVSFLVTKAALLCLRGTRVNTKSKVTEEGDDFSFKLNQLGG